MCVCVCVCVCVCTVVHGVRSVVTDSDTGRYISTSSSIFSPICNNIFSWGIQSLMKSISISIFQFLLAISTMIERFIKCIHCVGWKHNDESKVFSFVSILFVCFLHIFTPILISVWFGLVWFGLVWFVGFYGISTFVGYLTPNPFLCK